MNNLGHAGAGAGYGRNTNVVTIEIYWIRHGYSCANLLKTLGKAGVGDAVKSTLSFHGWLSNTRGILVPNTDLSMIGVRQAELVSTKFENIPWYRNIDLVCSSEAVRAIETAALVSQNIPSQIDPNNTIYILPHTSEIRHKLAFGDHDNIPEERGITLRKISNFQRAMRREIPGYHVKTLNYGIKNIIKIEVTKNGNIQKIKDEVLPEIFLFVSERYRDNDTIRIIIVSHQKTIKKLHNITRYKVPNCGIIRDIITYHKAERIYRADFSNFTWIYPQHPSTSRMPLRLTFPDNTYCNIETNLNIKTRTRKGEEQEFNLGVKRCIEAHHVSLCGTYEGTTPRIEALVDNHTRRRGRVDQRTRLPQIRRRVNTNESVSIGEEEPAPAAAKPAEVVIPVPAAEAAAAAVPVLAGGSKKIYIKSVGYRKIRKTKKGRKYVLVNKKENIYNIINE